MRRGDINGRARSDEKYLSIKTYSYGTFRPQLRCWRLARARWESGNLIIKPIKTYSYHFMASGLWQAVYGKSVAVADFVRSPGGRDRYRYLADCRPRQTQLCRFQPQRVVAFDTDHWEVLAESLKAQARSHSVSAAVDSNWGTRHSIGGAIDTPSGRQPRPRVRTVWIVESGSTEPRLITAHPVSEKTK